MVHISAHLCFLPIACCPNAMNMDIVLHRRKTRRRTTYQERYSAMSANDVFMMTLVQRCWAHAILQQRQARRHLTMCLAMNIDGEDEDVFLAMIQHYLKTKC